VPVAEPDPVGGRPCLELDDYLPDNYGQLIIRSLPMPYFIYEIGPLNILNKRAQAASFKEAKAVSNELRKGLDPNTGTQIKMIFAETELQAEDTLSQPRDPAATFDGEDY
jgi:hypothetical protein